MLIPYKDMTRENIIKKFTIYFLKTCFIIKFEKIKKNESNSIRNRQKSIF
jgi:hypothetical protein